jgi:hypothetical protein
MTYLPNKIYREATTVICGLNSNNERSEKYKITFCASDEIEAVRAAFKMYVDYENIEGMSSLQEGIIFASCSRSMLPCNVYLLNSLIDPLSYFVEHHEELVDLRLDNRSPATRFKAAGYAYRQGYIAGQLLDKLTDFDITINGDNSYYIA